MNEKKTSRREFIGRTITSGALVGTIANQAQAEAEKEITKEREVRLEYLQPHEIDKAMKERPVLYQPLGTIEWHGYHNNVGVDALKAHRLCVLAAQQSGGLVAPSLYGGIGGLNQPHTFVMEKENKI